MNSQRMKVLAALLVALASAAFLTHMLLAPKVLRIAVGPMGGSDLRVVVAFLQALQRERAGIRLKLVMTDGTTQSAAKLVSGAAELAVLRSDIAMPPQAATMAILRRDAVFFVTRPGSKITKINDLRGKTLGLVDGRSGNKAILERILAHYELPKDTLTLQPGTPAETLQAMQDNRLDAVFIVAPTSDRFVRSVMQAFPEHENEKAGFMPISEADALIELDASLDSIEIVKGVFGGDPALPESATTTLATTHRLVAHRTLDETLISELTRLLFTLRPAIAAEAALANQIELPSGDDRGAKLPLHAGTLAYIKGETKSFFDRYGDWFYLGVMGFSLVGSVIAALYSKLFRSRPRPSREQQSNRFLDLLRAAREAVDLPALAALEMRTDDYLSELIEDIDDDTNVASIAALGLVVQDIRQIIAEKRRALAN